MTAQALLDRLDGVRITGSGTWLAKCPAHDDGRPSLSVRELDDGRVLVHCFGGCAANEIVHSVGLELADLFPPKAPTKHHTPGERRPFPAADILRAILVETIVVMIVGAKVAEGKRIDPAERNRVALAASRIAAAVDVAIPPKDRRAEYREARAIAEADLAESDDGSSMQRHLLQRLEELEHEVRQADVRPSFETRLCRLVGDLEREYNKESPTGLPVGGWDRAAQISEAWNRRQADIPA